MASRIISPQQIEAVINLAGPKRYAHFIKHIADTQKVWGLWSIGWAMGSDDDGNPTFQLWPAKEYATLCANGVWAGYEAAEIALDDLVTELIPKLQADGVQVSVFRTPEGQSVMPSHVQLLADLKVEMARYD